ncbi:unnamed protein product [Allacma fusca]|uniref:Uncharacterized protein n=1 Tax=Allacma fusca TaxID=39272 RepID=A0A8J2JCE6_9HEXA|nr:unnamed protein product [Allacma fusca]
MLFISFINDLLDRTENHHTTCADDLRLNRRIDTMEDLVSLQKDTIYISEWTKANGMKINLKKLEALHIARCLEKPSHLYTVDGSGINFCESVRNLGLKVTGILRRNKQIHQVNRKAGAILDMISVAS